MRARPWMKPTITNAKVQVDRRIEYLSPPPDIHALVQSLLMPPPFPSITLYRVVPSPCSIGGLQASSDFFAAVYAARSRSSQDRWTRRRFMPQTDYPVKTLLDDFDRRGIAR